MTKEVLNDFLDCPMAFQSLGFWKNYEKNVSVPVPVRNSNNLFLVRFRFRQNSNSGQSLVTLHF